jgi:hypothetical protein
MSFEPQASCLKLISALADSLMLVFQQPDNIFPFESAFAAAY